MQGFRYEQRKKKRINRVLNVAISIVTILILFFVFQIFFSSTSSEEVATEETVEEMEPESTPNPKKEAEEELSKDDIEETDANTDEEFNEDEEIVETVLDGEWKPIGTEQTEFTSNFSSGSQNRIEMEKAIRYATGLDHNMTVWRIENGGSPTRVRGVVSGKENPSQPYEVYIEWIDGQGWMPVSKNQLTSNPYR